MDQDQDQKLSFFGIGPVTGVILIPVLAASIAATVRWPHIFMISGPGSRILFYSGLVILAAGLVFYFSTVRLLLKGLRETRLMTTGPYSLCQNPLYASILLVIVPAVALMMNTWLILLTTIAGYVVFRIYIRREYSELEKFFGEDYRIYRTNTPEFFPLPLKKWFGRKQ